jgi:hypothetical protein
MCVIGRYSEVAASAPRLPIGLNHECAAKTWATAPPLKTVVLIGSMVSGARRERAREHDLGDLGHRLGDGPEAPGQSGGHPRPQADQSRAFVLFNADESSLAVL